MTAKDASVFRSRPLQVDQAARRLDLQLDGIDISGPSFEVRLYVNHPDADAGTPTSPETGYVGSLHVYGYGMPGRSAPVSLSLNATEALKRAAVGGPVTVTVVPVGSGVGALRIEGVSIRAYS